VNKDDLKNDHWKWSDNYLRHLGNPKTLHDDSPNGYIEHLPFSGAEENPITSKKFRDSQLESNLKDGKALAGKSGHE
jgi:hypothetical protein